ncbi:MAG: cytidine/deoxycytidylate deaminase family protein [Candidatus Micrarchaeota archaeon]
MPQADGRPTFDEYFMRMCYLVAERSTCKRHKYGSVIVRGKRLLATGYNGAPKGLPHCLEIGCLRDELGIASGTRHEICRAVHAEQNAILQCALHGISADGATLYINEIPCRICAKMIINAGIKRVVYTAGKYPDKEAFELFEKAEVKMDKLDESLFVKK